MKNISTASKLLLTYLNKKKIVTMDEVKVFLNTNTRMTAFRKLSQINYITSCSHSGKYYTLKRIARFNQNGIWIFKSVVFSKYGTLKKTLENMIENSSRGYTASELNSLLKIKVEDALSELSKSKVVIRKKMTGVYVYYSKSSNLYKQQELKRKNRIQCVGNTKEKPKFLMNELKATLIIFYSTLSEKQRRLYAGLESLKGGRGGDKFIAEILDIDQKTVARGKRELLSGEVDVDTIRKLGGGRKKIKKKIPAVVEQIEKLMEYETAGDPMSDLKWTRKTTQKIADELANADIKISKTTVGILLKDLNFSLKTNVKRISNGGRLVTKEERESRNRQFLYINEMRSNFNKMGMPAISVDSKKKELIGNFKNPGTRYKRESDLTNDHDFLTYALGKAALYAAYDQEKNNGFVSIGMFPRNGNKLLSGDTPEFAVESIERWWIHEGIKTYHNTDEILILADAGGSNGYKPHMWKVKLQELLCDKYKLKVTVCHYPPGASKWNVIEHRLFNEITKNWKGTPLIDYETVLKYIKTTKTKTGLRVNAVLVDKIYEKGLKASEKDLQNLNIKQHDLNSSWNYTLYPN